MHKSRKHFRKIEIEQYHESTKVMPVHLQSFMMFPMWGCGRVQGNATSETKNCFETIEFITEIMNTCKNERVNVITK